MERRKKEIWERKKKGIKTDECRAADLDQSGWDEWTLLGATDWLRYRCATGLGELGNSHLSSRAKHREMHRITHSLFVSQPRLLLHTAKSSGHFRNKIKQYKKIMWPKDRNVTCAPLDLLRTKTPDYSHKLPRSAIQSFGQERPFFHDFRNPCLLPSAGATLRMSHSRRVVCVCVCVCRIMGYSLVDNLKCRPTPYLSLLQKESWYYFLCHFWSFDFRTWPRKEIQVCTTYIHTYIHTYKIGDSGGLGYFFFLPSM